MWYNREADDTYKLWGGIALTGVLMIGCFLTELMTPELLHTIIGFTSGWVVSRNHNGNGDNDNERKFKP